MFLFVQQLLKQELIFLMLIMMIVEDADKFGLAQLYQIRGRVGRSERGAYAYLLYKKDKSIQDDALKRLKAIKEFTELVVLIKLPCVIYQFVVQEIFLGVNKLGLLMILVLKCI